MENWIQIIVSIISGLLICVPLVIKLVEYVIKAIQEKNWQNVMQLVLRLMTEAEKNFETGFFNIDNVFKQELNVKNM